MFSKELIESLKITKYGAILSGLLGILLLGFSVYVLKIGIEKYNILINGDNLTYIFGGLALSGLILIITPMYFGIKDREIEKEIEIKKIENIANYENRKEILEKLKIVIKEFPNKKIGFNEFNMNPNTDSKLIYKDKIEGDRKGKRIEIYFGLDKNDFGRFFIYTSSKNIKEKIVKNSDFKKDGRFYNYKDYKSLEDIEIQLKELIEFLEIKK